ncbi:MAG: hypothetical protein WCB79_00395, partial [Halobacteriota archaeon]
MREKIRTPLARKRLTIVLVGSLVLTAFAIANVATLTVACNAVEHKVASIKPAEPWQPWQPIAKEPIAKEPIAKQPDRPIAKQPDRPITKQPDRPIAKQPDQPIN